MAQSSILGGEKAPAQARGRDTDALGPSDSSDSGSDVQGERAHVAADPDDAGALPADLASDTDASGTGERGAAIGDDPEDGADIRPDHIEDVDALDAGTADLDEVAVEELALDDTDEEADEPASR